MLLLEILLYKVAPSVMLRCLLPSVLRTRRLRRASERKRIGKLCLDMIYSTVGCKFNADESTLYIKYDV